MLHNSWPTGHKLKMGNGSYFQSHLPSITVHGNQNFLAGVNGVGLSNNTLLQWTVDLQMIFNMSEAEKQRNSFLYSLLSSPGFNGLEAYRTLIQQNEPVSKNRSMGLLNVIMNWPAFSNKLS